MRRTITLAVIALAGLLGLALPVAARPDVPTCLIGNGRDFTKTLTCVELVTYRHGDVGSGRYAAAPGSGRHTLIVTVEYQMHEEAPWVPLASAVATGWGDLSASTRMVRAPRPAALRACVTVSGYLTDGALCSR
jgi:hypothetical protein